MTWRRLLVTVLSAFGLVLGVLSVTAGPAAAATKLIHHDCSVVGTSGGYQGVQCVDLYTDNAGLVWSDNEILCQTTSGTLVECAGIHETPGACQQDYQCNYSPQGICGVRFGHTACGVRRVVNESPLLLAYCSRSDWGITIGTSIVLPNGTTVNGGLTGTPWIPPSSNCI